jgi:hypothetical protein
VVDGCATDEIDWMTADEEELSFPEVSGEVDEESSPQAASIAAKETATQPTNNFFMDFLPLRP